MALHAILIAGGQLPADLRSRSRFGTKALLEVRGRSLLDSAFCAARDSGLFERIVVSGNDEVKENLPDGLEYVELGPDVVGNILNAYEMLGESGNDYMILSPDLPMVSAAAVKEFVTRSTDSAELCLPVVSSEDFLAMFPEPRTDSRSWTVDCTPWEAASTSPVPC